MALKVVPNYAEGIKCTAKATWIRLYPDGTEQSLNQLKLVNMPLKVLIPETVFDFFVTLDTQGSVGYEHTLVIYQANGQVVRDLKLEDVLTTQEILDHVELTVSSRWWRKDVSFMFEVPSTETIEDKGNHIIRNVKAEPENAKLHITFPWGKRVVIKLSTGEVLP